MFVFYFGITKMTQIVIAFLWEKKKKKVQQDHWVKGLCVWWNQASKVTPIKT